MTNINDIISSSVMWVPAVCTETPFHINEHGEICYLDKGPILTKRKKTFLGLKDVPWGPEGYEIVKALNNAFQLGYEKDRGEWKGPLQNKV